MPTNDELFREMASELIAEFGVTGTIENPRVAGSFNPLLGSFDQAAGDPLVATVTMSPPVPIDVRQLDGTVVEVGDSVIYVDQVALDAVNGLEPKPGGQVVIAGSTWTITKAQPYYSGSLIAAWAIFLRS